MKLIEPPLAEPHERWCERSEIPQSEEFPPTRFVDFFYSQQKNKVIKFGDTELNKLSPYSSKCDRII